MIIESLKITAVKRASGGIIIGLKSSKNLKITFFILEEG